MKTRVITTTIQSLVEMFRDYFPDGDVPADASAVRLYFNPTIRKFAIELSSPSWSGELPPLEARFENKRVFTV